MKNELIILGLIILGIGFVAYGSPEEYKFVATPPFFEVTWNSANEDIQQESIMESSQTNIRSDITIESFEPRHEIYKPGDEAFVDFVIINELEIPYNVSVDWLFNNTRYHGWTNESTSIYNTTQKDNIWWSSYMIYRQGEWVAHLVVNYSLNGETISSDSVTKFEVI